MTVLMKVASSTAFSKKVEGYNGADPINVYQKVGYSLHEKGRMMKRAAVEHRFNRAKRDLEERGVRAYSLHKRIAIPKKELSLKDLRRLGFRSSYTGIPEPGQVRFVSYRHRDGYHIHDHGDHWVMHKDAYNPLNVGIKGLIMHGKEEALPAFKDFVNWDKGAIMKYIPV